MQHISLTPFGRQPVTAGLMAARALGDTKTTALPCLDKWALFNDLRVARANFGVSDRDLGVLYALLSFLPAKMLESDANLVVFPSNASLSDRAHGMAESTLRRHLAALVRAGLIWRQDSPNGKRYAARDRAGEMVVAYGFDLRPLLLRSAEIMEAANMATQAALTLRRDRERLVLNLRDAAKLLQYAQEEGLPGSWLALEDRLTPLRKALRRKLSMTDLQAMLQDAGDILRAISAMLAMDTEYMTGSAAHFERHLSNSNKDSQDSELPQEQMKAENEVPSAASVEEPRLPLALVLKACPDLPIYARNNLQNWRDLIATAAELRGMMGISATAWSDAQIQMGAENAAITLCAMMQRLRDIQNPGGYLRALTAKAAAAAFSPGPMIMSLLNSGGIRQS